MNPQLVSRQRWGARFAGGLLLAGCGGSLHGSASVPNAPPEVPEAPPMPGALWAPSEPIPAAPGGFAWSEVKVQTACAAATSTSAGSPQTITSAAEFERAFCQKPQLDFGRFRLVILKVAHPAVAVDVVPNAERISVIVQTRRGCDAEWGSQVALLVPADAKPVVLIERPGPAPECRDGYGY